MVRPSPNSTLDSSPFILPDNNRSIVRDVGLHRASRIVEGSGNRCFNRTGDDVVINPLTFNLVGLNNVDADPGENSNDKQEYEYSTKEAQQHNYP